MNQQPVHLNDAARGEGPPMVVLHGLYGAGNNWGRHVKWLAEDWQVHTPDLRNHGRSPHAAPMSYEAMAADVAALLDRAGHEQAVILGHSMGGKAAMTLALTRPERVRALIVADIAPVTYAHEHGEVIRAMQAVDLTTIRSRRDADAALADAVPEAPIRQFLLTNLEQGDHGWQWRLPLARLAEALPAIQGFPDLPGTWDGPALFIHGARSDYVDDTGRERIRARFPGAEIETLPEAGHFLHVEAPEAFHQRVAAWLARTLG